MIRPIQPVGFGVNAAAAACCRFRLSLACVLAFRNLNAIWAERRVRMELPNHLAAPLADVLAARLRCRNVLPGCVECREPPPASLPAADVAEPWRPWPARGPFATEVRRWWPSDEFPPLPPVVVQQEASVRVPFVTVRPAAGTLLDSWL